MASLSSILEAHNAPDKKRADRIKRVETWIVKNLKPQYRTHKELKKILRALKAKKVGTNAEDSMDILYTRDSMNVQIGNSRITLSEALSAWNGEDFVLADSHSEATDDHTSDEVESIPDKTLVSVSDAFQNKYPDFFREVESSGSKRREPERSHVPDAAAADSNGSASGPEQAPPKESVWTSTKSTVSSTERANLSNKWNYNERTDGKIHSFDSDSDDAQCMSATEANPKKQKIRENVFGTVPSTSSLFGSGSVKSTPACASPSEKVLETKPKRQMPTWVSSGQQTTPAASGGSSSKPQKINAKSTPLERLNSMNRDLLWSLRISFGLTSEVKTKPTLIAQLGPQLNDVYSKRGFGIHKLKGDIRSAGHLPQLTFEEYVMLWNGEDFDDPLPPPIVKMQEPVMTSQALDKQTVVKEELKPKESVPEFVLATSRSAERKKAKAQRTKEEEMYEIKRRQNLSVEERDAEDAETLRENNERQMLQDAANDARKRNALVSDTDSTHVSGPARENIQGWYSDHPSMQHLPYASIDSDKSQMQTMRPFGLTQSPETSLQASIVID